MPVEVWTKDYHNHYQAPGAPRVYVSPKLSPVFSSFTFQLKSNQTSYIGLSPAKYQTYLGQPMLEAVIGEDVRLRNASGNGAVMSIEISEPKPLYGTMYMPGDNFATYKITWIAKNGMVILSLSVINGGKFTEIWSISSTKKVNINYIMLAGGNEVEKTLWRFNDGKLF